MSKAWTMALAAACLAACGEAGAPDEARRQLDLKISIGRRVGAPLAAAGEGLSLTAGDAGVVEARVDAMTGAPSRILYDTAAAATTWSSAAELAPAAAALIAELYRPHADTSWSAAPRGEARDLGEGLHQVSFTVAVGDVPVRDASIDVYFVRRHSDGALVLREVFARHAVIPDGATLLAAASGLDSDWAARLGLDTSHDEVARRRVIFAREIALDVHTYELADEVALQDRASGERLTVTLGAREGGEVLEAFTDKIGASTLTARTYPRSYQDTAIAQPFAFARVMAGGVNYPLNGAGATDETLDGDVVVALESGRARIVGANGPYQVAATVTDGRADLMPAGNDLNAINAFLAIQRVNGFARRQLATSDAAILQRTVPVSINVQGSCNAFYQNTTISLFREGQGCANMAVVNDVIYHEWGHGLDDYTGTAGGITDGAFSEGIGDILAAYLVGDANMGTGFFTNSPNGVRNLRNTRRFPENQGPVHEEGQIIGGAFWDLRVALIARYGATKGAFMAERFFLRHLVTTDTYRDSYDAVLRLDDDDANPATRSPNHCLINGAFAAHGLATAMAGCTDDPGKRGYSADQSIAAAIMARSEGGLRLMAAADSTARTMRACIGDAQMCADLDGTAWKAMKLDGTLEGKVAFVHERPVAIPDGSLVWLAAYDGEGALVGRRAVKIVGR